MSKMIRKGRVTEVGPQYVTVIDEEGEYHHLSYYQIVSAVRRMVSVDTEVVLEYISTPSTGLWNIVGEQTHEDMNMNMVLSLKSVIDDIENIIDLINYDGPHTVDPETVFRKMDEAEKGLCSVKWRWEDLYL